MVSCFHLPPHPRPLPSSSQVGDGGGGGGLAGGAAGLGAAGGSLFPLHGAERASQDPRSERAGVAGEPEQRPGASNPALQGMGSRGCSAEPRVDQLHEFPGGRRRRFRAGDGGSDAVRRTRKRAVPGLPVDRAGCLGITVGPLLLHSCSAGMCSSVIDVDPFGCEPNALTAAPPARHALCLEAISRLVTNAGQHALQSR